MVYFNTFYNAEISFKKAMKIIEESPIVENNELPSQAKKLLGESIDNSKLVIKNYPESKYVDDAIFIIDTSNGVITDCNPRSSELTGYNNSELKGLHNSKLFPVELRTELRLFLKYNLTRNEYTVNETYIKTKLGETIPVEIASGKIFQVDNIKYLVCFLARLLYKIHFLCIVT